MLKSAKGRQLAQMMPAERVLTETDAPFTQMDGKPLMPWDVSRTYPVLADLWKVSESAVQVQLNANLRSLLDAMN